MQEQLTGRLLAQAADLPRRAPGAKRAGPNCVKHSKLDTAQRIAACHDPSLRAIPPGSSVAERAPNVASFVLSPSEPVRDRQRERGGMLLDS